MDEQHIADDQSHYEISLTAGQAFVSFVLLLLSLAAAFAFGLTIGRGQADERLVVQKETPVITEAAMLPKKTGEITELGVTADDFASASKRVAEEVPVVEEEELPTPVEQPPAPQPAAEPARTVASPETADVAPAAKPATVATPAVPHYAQLLSTSDQKAAEALAARVIDRGFTSAYVQRGETEKGTTFRVRVRFESETAARAAEGTLREFSKEVWITSR